MAGSVAPLRSFSTSSQVRMLTFRAHELDTPLPNPAHLDPPATDLYADLGELVWAWCSTSVLVRL